MKFIHINRWKISYTKYGDPIPNGYNGGSENVRIRKHPLQNLAIKMVPDIYYSIRYDGFAAYKYSDVFLNIAFIILARPCNEEKGLLIRKFKWLFLYLNNILRL